MKCLVLTLSSVSFFFFLFLFLTFLAGIAPSSGPKASEDALEEDSVCVGASVVEEEREVGGEDIV